MFLNMTKENHESIGKIFVHLNPYKALILLVILKYYTNTRFHWEDGLTE